MKGFILGSIFLLNSSLHAAAMGQSMPAFGSPCYFEGQTMDYACQNGVTVPVGMSTYPAPLNSYDCIACKYQPVAQRPIGVYRNFPVSSEPWWNNYNQFNYVNRNAPAPWGQWGIDAAHYSGRGNMVAGKPNVYFSAPKGSKISYKINFKKESNLLAAMPIHGSEGWSFEMLDDDKFQLGKVKHDYIYYDYRLFDKDFQVTKGFCPSKEDTVKAMIKVLAKMGFKKNELDDFANYWAYKTPKQPYCIYPQTHKELDEIANWQIKPEPKYITRVLFVLVPKNIILKKKVTRFTSLPKEEWKPLYGISRNPASSNDNKFEVREWGVAFAVEK